MIEPVVVIVRLLQYTGAMILLGSSLFFLYALPSSGAASAAAIRGVRWLPAGGAALLAVTSLLAVATQASVLTGTFADGFTVDAMTSVVSFMSLGKAAVVRAGAATAALCTLIALRPGRTSWALAVVLGFIATLSLGWMGHAAASEGPGASIHLISDIIHVLAGAVWIGALAAFLLLLVRSPRTAEERVATHAALERFSGVGSIIVAAVVLTGIVNSWILIGPDRLSALVTTPYGRLLGLKLVLFAWMLLLAVANRFRLTPGLAAAEASGQSALAIAALRRSIALEAALGLGVLFLVSWFGTLVPPASA